MSPFEIRTDWSCHNLRSHLTSKNTKILMYKVLIRPVLTYASETWTLSKTNERRVSLFERKALRCIFGAKQENEIWRKRYSYELYETFNEPNFVNYIKVNRLAWEGHVMGTNNDRTLKKNIQHQTVWSKRSWKIETAMARWSWSRYENIRGQELEEGRPRQRRMGKASEEGQGPPRAVEPMMMNLAIKPAPYHWSWYLDFQQVCWIVLSI